MWMAAVGAADAAVNVELEGGPQLRLSRRDVGRLAGMLPRLPHTAQPASRSGGKQAHLMGRTCRSSVQGSGRSLVSRRATSGGRPSATTSLGWDGRAYGRSGRTTTVH